MSDQRHQAEKPLAIGERRTHARTPVSPQAFVKFGGSNYGFVFNISESGLVFAPTGTLSLSVGAIAKMRFLLPESQEWIETSGEVAWIADSQKEAGVRFVDLAHDTRDKIRNWISQEPSRAQPDRQRDLVPKSDKNPKDGAPLHASSGSLGAQSGTFVDGKALNSILADPAKLLLETKTSREKLAPQQQKIATNEPSQAAGSLRVPERRSHVRRRVLSLEYIDLGSSNGGILLNLSEGGMYVQAVASLSDDELPQIAFRLPDSGYLVKTGAQIAWVGDSRKDAGIQFVNLPEEARLKIREWVAVEHPPLEVTNKPETNVPPPRKKNERLLEMPAPSQSKKTAGLQETPARIPQRRDSAIAPPPSVASAAPAAPNAAELLHLSGPILQTRFSEPPKSEVDTAELSAPGVVQRRSWWGLAVGIVIVVLVSFIAGWVAAGPGGRKQFVAMFERQQNNTSETAQNSEAPPAPAAPIANIPVTPQASVSTQQPKQPASSAPTVTNASPGNSRPAKPDDTVKPAPSASKSSNVLPAHSSPSQAQKPAPPAVHADVPSIKSSDAGRDTRPSQPLKSSTASNSSGAPAQNKTQAIQPAEQPHTIAPAPVSNSAVKNTPPPAASNASLQPGPSTTAAEKPNATPVATQPPAHAEPSPPSPPVKAPEPAAVVKGTVSVSASPFPSIRVPPELKSQISKQGASVQMGQLISRVEPVYPEDAERQRIEGVVKLHMIIDRDGNIQDVDKMTGPPLLVAAAANAVRQWRYKPTSLGGQPVEAGVDVTVVFRLQTTHAN